MEQQFYEQIKRILFEARNKVYQTANFAMPDITKEPVDDQYEVISHYLFFQKYPSLEVKIDKNGISNLEYHEVLEKVIKNFELCYGEFLSAILRDIPAVIDPYKGLYKIHI